MGQPYNAAMVQEDVRKLWNMGRFEDIRVETATGAEGTAVVFDVEESRRLRLHKLRIEPSLPGLHVALPEGAPLDRRRAQAIALEAQKQLEAEGFDDAHVDYRLAPLPDHRADLVLELHPGKRVRVKQVEFGGDLGVQPAELRSALRALRARRLFGWRLLAAYSADAANSDLARLRSFYLSRGYFDATVRIDDTEIHEKEARLRFFVHSGPLYQVRNLTVSGTEEESPSARTLCSSLLAARRDAQRQGVLDFSATVDVQPIGTGEAGPSADLAATITTGRPYRVGRIEFAGNHHWSESMLRRNFLLDEGALFDERLLRESIARLNRSMLFEPIDETRVSIHADQSTGIADVRIPLVERKRGAWRLSGPVGTASFAGPLEASISSRLPAWGSGLLSLGTYTASFSLLAFAQPMLPLLAIDPRRKLLPVLALSRPFNPADGWKSGFLIAPALGWRATAFSYPFAQIQQRLLPRLTGETGREPELQVAVHGPAGEGVMFCEPPAPRMLPLRRTAAMMIRFAGAFAGQ